MAHTPNPRRVEAGRCNRSKRKGLTPDGREKLRQVAIEHQPWRHSTGPRTPEDARGMAGIRSSNRARQKGPLGIAAIRVELGDYRILMSEMREAGGMVYGMNWQLPWVVRNRVDFNRSGAR